MAISLVTAFATAVSAIGQSAISTTIDLSATNPLIVAEYTIGTCATRNTCAKGVRWDVCGANQALLTAGRVTSTTSQTSRVNTGIFYLAAPTVGTGILRANSNGTVVGTQGLGVTIWSGATGVRTFASRFATNGGTATVTAASTTGDIVVDQVAMRGTAVAKDPSTLAAGADQTERWDRSIADGNAFSGASMGFRFGGSTQAGEVCALMAWATATGVWAQAGISIAPTAAGAPPAGATRGSQLALVGHR